MLDFVEVIDDHRSQEILFSRWDYEGYRLQDIMLYGGYIKIAWFHNREGK
jgi:hypothetical protein